MSRLQSKSWVYLTCLVLSVATLIIGCDDESATREGGSQAAGMSAGQVSAGVDVPLSGIEPPIAGVSSGVEAGVNAWGGAGGPGVCLSCNDDCPPVECDCPVGGPSSFDGCQEGCCQASSEERCGQLCDSLRPPPECEIGESRCLEGTPSAIQRCTTEQQWEIAPCEAETECQLDRCLPDRCVEGTRECLDSSRVAECQDGGWVLAETCDEVCAGGECMSAACANSIREQSYLGCEYVSIELPNFAASEPAAAPPVAIVLTNPSSTEPAHVSLFNPSGELSELQSQVLLPLPMHLIDNPLPGYMSPQTITSEIRDSSGAVVEEGVLRADQLRIPPGGIGTLLLPNMSWPELGSVVEPRAYRVVSDSPVGAYQFAPYCCNYSFSNDASLLVPTSALTGNYRYLGAPAFTLTYDEDFSPLELPATMAIVGVRDGTTVRLTLPERAFIQGDVSGRLSQSGGQYVATLDRQETLLIRTQPDPLASLFNPQPPADLTGALIEADEPVAVFSGHECTFYPHNLGKCDHLEEQLFPVETWGRQFNLIPAPERGEGSPLEVVYWKLLASEPGTRVTLSASLQALQAGGAGSEGVPDCAQHLDPSDPSVIIIDGEGYCELNTKVAFSVSSDKPISVMGILSGQESVEIGAGYGKHLGDPAAFLAAPIRQYRADYAFLTPDTYFSDYVTIAFNEGTQITLDGEVVDTSAAQTVTGSQTRYLHVTLEDGPHQMRGTAPIGITLFAFDDFVSYAFTGGLNLTKR